MTETEFVSFIVFGFSLSMVLFFFGQVGRVFTDVVDSYLDRK